jgi:hypothetical protein
LTIPFLEMKLSLDYTGFSLIMQHWCGHCGSVIGWEINAYLCWALRSFLFSEKLMPIYAELWGFFCSLIMFWHPVLFFACSYIPSGSSDLISTRRASLHDMVFLNSLYFSLSLLNGWFINKLIDYYKKNNKYFRERN